MRNRETNPRKWAQERPEMARSGALEVLCRVEGHFENLNEMRNVLEGGRGQARWLAAESFALSKRKFSKEN